MRRIKVKTKEKIEVQNITGQVSDSLEISDGFIVVHIPHTTAGLTINENEENLKSDMAKFYAQLAKGSWAHNRIDNNAEAHLAATTLNSSLVIPVSKGGLALGTWQSILLIELDGPRERSVYISELSA
jgi:secondary thiamine-phosphate synthase enzyme